MFDYIENIHWGVIITISATTIGIIGGLITIADKIKNRRVLKEFNEFINRQNEHGRTVEEIDTLKHKKNIVLHEISETIPTLGKIAVLQDQKVIYEKSIQDNFLHLQQITTELNSLKNKKNEANLSPELRTFLINEISDKATLQKKIDFSKNSLLFWLSVFILATGFEIPVLPNTIAFLLLINLLGFHFLYSQTKHSKNSIVFNYQFFYIIIGSIWLVLGTLSIALLSLIYAKNLSSDEKLITLIPSLKRHVPLFFAGSIFLILRKKLAHITYNIMNFFNS